MTQRLWHRGPPPHIGWWNASVRSDEDAWRWWNGSHWSLAAFPSINLNLVLFFAKNRSPCERKYPIAWTYHWPVDGRVARINPKTREVTGKIKEMK